MESLHFSPWSNESSIGVCFIIEPLTLVLRKRKEVLGFNILLFWLELQASGFFSSSKC